MRSTPGRLSRTGVGVHLPLATGHGDVDETAGVTGARKTVVSYGRSRACGWRCAAGESYRILFLARPLGVLGFSVGSTCRLLSISTLV